MFLKKLAWIYKHVSSISNPSITIYREKDFTAYYFVCLALTQVSRECPDCVHMKRIGKNIDTSD